MRILLVYGYEPSGHASAARALETCARAQGHEARCFNISAEHHKILGPAIAKSYLGLVQRLPGLYDALHESETLAEISQIWREVYRVFEGGRLRAKLEELRPDVIVCTHAPALGALALEKVRGGLEVPLAAVITDFQAHPYWTAKGPDLFLTATKEAAAALIGRGAAPKRVKATGIPLHPVFARPVSQGSARRALGLPEQGLIALVTGGGRGLGRLADICEILLARPGLSVAAVCGSNQEVQSELKHKFSRERRVRVFGKLEPELMREAMCAADFLVGKAGGLTSSECLAIGLPLVLFEPLAGQEERNAEFLVRGGAALRADSLEEFEKLLVRLTRAETREALKKRAKALGKPDAAARALEALLALADGWR